MGSLPRDIVLGARDRFGDISDSFQIRYKRNQEINKFRDDRRKEIYEHVILTKEQKKSIDDIYISCYGEKIPYIWHRHYTAFTGNFDARYFPELLYIPEFERFCNIYPEYVKSFCDKNLLPYVASAANVKMPQTLLSSTRGFIRDSDNHPISFAHACDWLSRAGEVFVKPSINTGSGVGCALLQMENGYDLLTGKAAIEILRELRTDYIIQNRIKCSSVIRKLYKESCNTFRVVTYRWKNSIRYMPVIMRIGRGGNHIDNAHAGGIFIGVNNDGTLKKTAFTEFNEKYLNHPDSGIVFENYKIAGYHNIVKSARKMHSMIPQLGVVNWDFTLDETNTPVLIEANTRGGGIWVLEMAHGTGPFGKDTEEVLRWMREMKRRKASQREEIAFGNI